MDWQPDWNLRVRMLLVLLVIVILPVVFVVTMLWMLNDVVPLLLMKHLGIPTHARIELPLSVIFVAVVVGIGIQYLFGDRMTLATTGAQTTSPSEQPELHATVQQLSQQVDMPKPTVAVVDTDIPNAFATGRTPRDSTITVTTGLLDILDGNELEAVLAHEIAHVKNRDAAVMTIGYLLPMVTFIVATTAYSLLDGFSHLFGYGHVSTRGRGGNHIIGLVLVIVTMTVLTMAVAVFFWAGSYLVYRLLSRYREYTADRGAARITGDPFTLAAALEKVDDTINHIPDADLRIQDGGVEALYVAPLDGESFDNNEWLVSNDIFPDTHPPTADRIERLQNLEFS